MAIGIGVACPKGPTRKQRKAKKDRHEAAVKKVVRAVCVERDGYCRLAGTTLCSGPSQWAHLGKSKRARTRGQAAERRHTSAGTAMLCQKHHSRYDAGLIRLELGEAGADGYFTALIDGMWFRC